MHTRLGFRLVLIAALFGTLPIAMGLGAGAEARQPLALAVVGGKIFSQRLTLFVTPVVYTYMDAVERRIGRMVQGKAEATAPESAA